MEKRTFGLVVKEHKVAVDSLKNEIHLVVSEYDLHSKTELDHLEEGQADIHLILTLMEAEKLSQELSKAIDHFKWD